MSDPFVGEVQIFGFDFAPRQWALCDGALLPLRQYIGLYPLIGTYYGGDGQTTFRLPNLVNRVAIGQGAGPGLTPRIIADALGTDGHTLTLNEMPAHNHSVTAYNGGNNHVTTPTPTSGFGTTGRGGVYTAANTVPDTLLSPRAMVPAGNNQPHENRQPFMALNYCIALQGVYPSFG
jgi:microcystin-dependent protein